MITVPAVVALVRRAEQLDDRDSVLYIYYIYIVYIYIYICLLLLYILLIYYI